MRALLFLLVAGCSKPVEPGDSEGVLPRDSPRDTSAPQDSPRDTAVAPDTAPPPCDTSETWYADRDGDGYGDPAQATTCDDPGGAAPDPTDCDDGHASVYPGAIELVTSGRDDDCDGLFGSGDLPDLAAWVASDGDEASVGFGADVALPGDLTGDGVPDLAVVSTAWDDGWGKWPGAVLVYQGSLDALDPTPYAVLTGDPLSWSDLYRVTGVGDVDGDGLSDLLFGGDDGVFLLRGPVPPGESEFAGLAQAWTDLTLTLSVPYLAGPGDVDGDGLADIAYGDEQAGENAGEVYLMLGPATQASSDDADVLLRGDDEARLGQTAALGDLDGDGLGDFGAVGHGSQHEGGGYRAYLVMDPPPGVYAPRDVAVTISHLEGGSTGVLTLERAGDLDGDGWEDLVLGHRDRYVYAIFGPFGDEPLLDLATEWDAAFTTPAMWCADLRQATPLGDWDGDGHPDLAIADQGYIPEEYRHDPDCWAYGVNLCNEGAVFLVAGPVAGGVIDLDTQADRFSPGFNIGFFPSAMAAGDDLTGDGLSDLVIGHDQYDLVSVLAGGALF